MEHVKTLLENDRIDRCKGPCGSIIVLALKPHQGHIKNINNFIWRICVSYKRLNSNIKLFEFPIPRCDDAIAIIDTGSQFIWVISLDARQGYHQVTVSPVLARFDPLKPTFLKTDWSAEGMGWILMQPTDYVEST